MPLTGHGLAYFRELVVDYKTLQWVNPYSAAADAAAEDANKKAKAANAVDIVFSSPPADSDLMTASDNARKLAEDARQKAHQLAAKEQMAQVAMGEARKLIDELIEKSKQDKQDCKVSWSDLLEFESALLRLLAGEKLRARYQSMVTEYNGLTGSAVPDAQKEELEDALRAKAETLLADIHWAYTTGPVQEEHRGRMVVALACVTAMVVLFTLPFVWLCTCPVLVWVAMAGAAGAGFSAFQRVQHRDVKGDALTNCEKAFSGETLLAKLGSALQLQSGFALAPVIGALCAIVLAHIFAAGLVSGSVFPEISRSTSTNALLEASPLATVSSNAPALKEPTVASVRTNSDASTNSSTSVGTPTKNNADESNEKKGQPKIPSCVGNCWCFRDCTQLALMLVWGFIAGFSERLVPDMISRLTDRTKASS